MNEAALLEEISLSEDEFADESDPIPFPFKQYVSLVFRRNDPNNALELES